MVDMKTLSEAKHCQSAILLVNQKYGPLVPYVFLTGWGSDTDIPVSDKVVLLGEPATESERQVYTGVWERVVRTATVLIKNQGWKLHLASTGDLYAIVDGLEITSD